MIAPEEKPATIDTHTDPGRAVVAVADGAKRDGGVVFLRDPERVVVKESLHHSDGEPIEGVTLVYAYLSRQDMQDLANSLARQHGIQGRP
jgi:hypothetical protein